LEYDRRTLGGALRNTVLAPRTKPTGFGSEKRERERRCLIENYEAKWSYPLTLYSQHQMSVAEQK